MEPMQPQTDEIADGIFRISTYIPEVTPAGFTFNQFLVVADEPLLYHTGMRGLFPLVAEAVARLVPVESLRWISFGHVEADESGSANMWLAAAPQSVVTFGALGCDVSLNDLCDRPPRPLAEGEVLDLGGKRVRQISTPHVPHGWEAQVLFEETTGTLFSGDLFSQVGAPAALTTDDIVEPALLAEELFHATALAPHTVATIRALGDLRPSTLAVMHGSSFEGDGRQALYDLAAGYEALTAQVAAAAAATAA
jgi:flavorubredoxin